MTPEQLEELPGIGPKTIEKISIAVNNYFSALEGGEVPSADSGGEEATPEAAHVGEGGDVEMTNALAGKSEYREAGGARQGLYGPPDPRGADAPAADVAHGARHR